jgi:hypothetical protein
MPATSGDRQLRRPTPKVPMQKVALALVQIVVVVVASAASV